VSTAVGAFPAIPYPFLLLSLNLSMVINVVFRHVSLAPENVRVVQVHAKYIGRVVVGW